MRGISQGDYMEQAGKTVPPEIEEALGIWRRSARVLKAAQTVTLLAAAICSILAASSVVGEASRPWFSLAAALAVAVMSAVDLGAKANGLRNAWRLMNAARLRYVREPGYTLEQLVGAYERAEGLIGDLPTGVEPR